MAIPTIFYYLKLVDLLYLLVLGFLFTFVSIEFPFAMVLSVVIVLGNAYFRRIFHMGLPSEDNPKGYSTGSGDCVIQ
eukprot:1013362-Pyramimonas_sp.AAC.1